MRSDDVRGRGYAPAGRTPEVPVNHKRASLGLISAVTNKGELRWMVLDGAIKAPDLLRLRIPTESSRRFRRKPAGNSDGSQPPIPTQASRP